MKRKMYLLALNAILSVLSVFMVALYPINGKTTFGKSGMWVVTTIVIIVGLLIIIATLNYKQYQLANVYQGFLLIVFLGEVGMGLMLTTGFLMFVTMFIGILGLVSVFCFYLTKW
ncbi:hypothetical protein RXV91_05260 [Lactiplantibacillus sp. DA1]|uniref:hypothetical protein n=1 Tax=Lactiplantibacillus sp. DA1 TaxID=3079857 RepID=UPI00292A61EF|nr:hypothetical protein [Lactiplantibacillus sp. DA1]MDV0430281.1 hypothetical protein [Lactiplantibacillus sp. DA1]